MYSGRPFNRLEKKGKVKGRGGILGMSLRATPKRDVSESEPQLVFRLESARALINVGLSAI